MINRDHDLPLTRQAQILGLSRSSLYYVPIPISDANLELMRRIDYLHTDYPFMGARMLRDRLKALGYSVGRRHVARLMRLMSIEALYRKKKTTKRNPEHHVFPYLLRGMTIDQPNQVWAADISYIPMRRGFLYLFAIIDWATRRALAWRLSNTLTTDFCIETVEEAIAQYGKPQIFNTEHVLYRVVKHLRSQKEIQPAIAGLVEDSERPRYCLDSAITITKTQGPRRPLPCLIHRSVRAGDPSMIYEVVNASKALVKEVPPLGTASS